MALTKITAGGLADDSVVTASVADSQVTLVKTSGVQTGWVKLESQTISSNVNEVDLTTGIGATYFHYMITITKLKMSTDAENFQARLRIGGTWITGSYYHFHQAEATAATTAPVTAESNAASSIKISNTGNDTSERQNYNVFFAAANTIDNQKGIWWNGYGVKSSANTAFFNGAGGVDEATYGALSGVRFFPSSGQIAEGTFALYGLIK